MGLFWSFGNS